MTDQPQTMTLTQRTNQQLAEQLAEQRQRETNRETAQRQQSPQQANQPAPAATTTIKNPEAHGKARAMQAYFADAGRVITPGEKGNNRFQGKYQMGRVKGLTADQANEKFEKLWEKAPDALREKYARMADPAAGLAPSERAKQLEEQRRKDAKENPVPMENPVPGADFEKLTEARPQKFNMDASGLATGPDGKIHDVGDGSTKDGVYSPSAAEEGRFPAANPASTLDSRIANSPAARAAKAVGGFLANAGPMERPTQMENRPASTAVTPTNTARPTVPATLSPSNIANPTPGKMPAPGTAITPGMSTDERMHAQGKTNLGGVPVEKAPLGVQTDSGTMKPVVPAVPARSLDGQRADAAGLNRGSSLADRQKVFAPKPGEELIGMKRGVPQYAPASELYGKSAIVKPPMAAPSLDSMRADYQARNQNRTAADRAMSSTTAVSPIAQPSQNLTRPAIPRGPASQPIQTSYGRNDPTVNQDQLRQHGEALKGAQSFGGSDADFNARRAEPGKLYGQANEITRIAMGGQTAQRAQGLLDRMKPTTTQPVSQRVVAQRPATPEGMDSMKPGALSKRRSEFAMVSR